MKPCVHQDPGERSSDAERDWPRLAQECPGISSGPRFLRTLHLGPSILGGSTWHGSQFHWVRQECGPCDQFDLFSYDCGFHPVCHLMSKGKMLMEASWWERLTVGETGSYSDGQHHAQEIFNPIFCWWVGLCSLPVVFLGANYGGGNEDNGNLLQRVPCSLQQENKNRL